MGGQGHRFHLGVDAGATRCRSRLRGFDGAIVAQAEGPAANAYVNFERAVEVVRAVVGEALRRAAIDTNFTDLGLGVAGISDAGEAARFAARFVGFASVHVVNDAVAACIGAHGGADGGLVVVGTGSAGVARVAGRETIVGGRGFHLGDDGSAARLGLEGARAAMRAADGLGPQSDLTRKIHARFHDDTLAMLHWAARASPRDYGELAPLVIEAAAAGDAVARALASATADAVAVLAERVAALGARRLAMVGGLGEALRPFLNADLSVQLNQPLFDPTDGAIALCGGVLPGLAA